MISDTVIVCEWIGSDGRNGLFVLQNLCRDTDCSERLSPKSLHKITINSGFLNYKCDFRGILHRSTERMFQNDESGLYLAYIQYVE